MADLQLAPARERSVLPAVLVSLILLAVIAAAVFYLNPHKVAELRVMEVQPFAPHTEMSAMRGANAHGMRVLNGASSTSEDDLYLVATVSFTDKLRLPLFVTGATAHVTFADGSQTDARMLSQADLQRLETIFPAIAALAANPINDGDEIDPALTRVGTVALLFPGRTADAWAKKRAGTLTLELRNQEPQTTRLP